MRNTMLTAALIAVLSVMSWSPNRADAQVVIQPTISGSPYAYTTYWNPGYNYAYTWTNPYYNMYSTAWSNPYNYGTWTWYNANPYNYWNSSPYVWRGRYWR